MKILLDECITKRLKKHLTDFEVYTVSEMNIRGTKNGKLMGFCVEHGFDILLTIDKNLMYQQNFDNYPLTIVVLNSPTSKVEDIVLYIPPFLLQIDLLEKHRAYVIDK